MNTDAKPFVMSSSQPVIGFNEGSGVGQTAGAAQNANIEEDLADTFIQSEMQN